jgi:hypothetical protein
MARSPEKKMPRLVKNVKYRKEFYDSKIKAFMKNENKKRNNDSEI